jgi:hypothetical protein
MLHLISIQGLDPNRDVDAERKKREVEELKMAFDQGDKPPRSIAKMPVNINTRGKPLSKALHDVDHEAYVIKNIYVPTADYSSAGDAPVSTEEARVILDKIMKKMTEKYGDQFPVLKSTSDTLVDPVEVLSDQDILEVTIPVDLALPEIEPVATGAQSILEAEDARILEELDKIATVKTRKPRAKKPTKKPEKKPAKKPVKKPVKKTRKK